MTCEHARRPNSAVSFLLFCNKNNKKTKILTSLVKISQLVLSSSTSADGKTQNLEKLKNSKNPKKMWEIQHLKNTKKKTNKHKVWKISWSVKNFPTHDPLGIFEKSAQSLKFRNMKKCLNFKNPKKRQKNTKSEKFRDLWKIWLLVLLLESWAVSAEFRI